LTKILFVNSDVKIMISGDLNNPANNFEVYDSLVWYRFCIFGYK